MSNMNHGARAAAERAFFTRDEAATVDAIAARIFPDDDLGPGARQADVVTYIDRALAGAEARFQQTYRTGIAALDRAAHARFGKDFVSCGEMEQDALIGALETDALPECGPPPQPSAFFGLLRAHTIEGVFSDPAHGGNRDLAGWKLLGYWGPQPGYSHAEQQLDAAIVRDRHYTAADYPLVSEKKA
jgi:hypothetical protein